MKYKFRYKNTVFKVLSWLLVTFQNFLLPQIVGVFLLKLVLVMGLGQFFTDDLINILYKILLICGLLWTLIFWIAKKGVYIYDDHLEISRYTVTLRNWKNKISINYSEIENINVNYNDIRFTKHYGSLLVPFGDNCYNIELSLKNGRKYFFSIENQEEFCETLNGLITQGTVPCVDENKG